MNLILNYLSQQSTYKGIFNILGSSGLFYVTPLIADAGAATAVTIVAAVKGVIGLIDVIRNEKKNA